MAVSPICGWTLEDAARKHGALRIAGVDEVGRGPLFGPVVAAAVILQRGCRLQDLNDSKKLTAKKRAELDVEIRENAVAWAIAEVDAETIDRINIRQASLLAMRQAVSQLALGPDYLLIDGKDTIEWEGPQKAVIHGDGTSFSIAAASVLAKVYRDRLLVEWDAEFPGYGLARHKGYGSPEHFAALARLGPTPLHRKTFHPVTQYVLQFDHHCMEQRCSAQPCSEPEQDEGNPQQDLALEAASAAPPDAAKQRFACPCCGFLTLEQEPPGSFGLCEVCWWEDDAVQFADPDYEGGANEPSLRQARELFRQIGVSDAKLKGHERAPRPEEIPAGAMKFPGF
jgi:ribonuclease HII